LIEQEKALAAYEREYSLPGGVVVPPGFKFKWLKQLCDLLEPLEEATRRVCTDAATAADVIPIAMDVKMSVQHSARGDEIAAGVTTTTYIPTSRVAKRYLCAPPTSVANEHLFSSATRVFTDRRNRLAPKKADMLLFIKHNLALINFKYRGLSVCITGTLCVIRDKTMRRPT